VVNTLPLGAAAFIVFHRRGAENAEKRQKQEGKERKIEENRRIRE
jgi:hypothetical protein